MVLADSDRIDIDNLPDKVREERDHAPQPLLGDDLSIKKAIRTIERELIRRSLEKTGGNRTRAADLLEISHRALLYKIKEYGLS
jgi:two-component system response regulator AtoC